MESSIVEKNFEWSNLGRSANFWLKNVDFVLLNMNIRHPIVLRGHTQTMWTAMGGGGVHEMSTLLIKPI